MKDAYQREKTGHIARTGGVNNEGRWKASFSLNSIVHGCSQVIRPEFKNIRPEFKDDDRDILSEFDERIAMFSSMRADVLKELQVPL
jgi:hypothetical protein